MFPSPPSPGPQKRLIPALAAAASVLTLSTVLGAATTAPASATPGQPSSPNALVAASGAAATSATSAASATSAIEDMSPVVTATSCEPAKRIALIRLGQALSKAYPRTGYTQRRTCSSPAVAEQRQGRVLTWKVSSTDARQRHQVDAWKHWLSVPDAAGHPYANVRRLGIVRLVWDDKEWRADRAAQGWRPYSTCQTTKSRKTRADRLRCGRSGMQIVLSWAGAQGKTSFWSGSVATQDFGPCRPADLSWAYGWSSVRTTPCPAYASLRTPAGATKDDRALIAWSGMRLRSGSHGAAVKAVQKALHVRRTGTFRSSTSSAVRAFQRQQHLPVTSETDAATWRSLLSTKLSVPMTTSPLGSGSTATPPTPPTSTPPTSTPPASTMPTTTPGTWRRMLSEDFDRPVGVGSFATASPDDWFLRPDHTYAKSLVMYPDGWGTTGDLSLNYSSRTLDVVDQEMGASGVLRLHAHTDTVGGRRRALGGSIFVVVDPNASGPAQVAQTYGRYSARFRTVGGYDAKGGARYGSAFLLWPHDDNWASGEVDYPEMGWGQHIGGFVHRQGKPWENSAVIKTGSTTDDGWHVATIEWRPEVLLFWLDGKLVSTVTHDVPQKPFRWGFQSGGFDGTPADGVEGKLLVDWITVDAYTGPR